MQPRMTLTPDPPACNSQVLELEGEPPCLISFPPPTVERLILLYKEQTDKKTVL